MTVEMITTTTTTMSKRIFDEKISKMYIKWNLMCRSKNTVHIHLNHITWGTDSLCIRFAHTKTDVEGGDKARIRHVFANPYNLDICAVTAAAKYLFQEEKLRNQSS